jgi:hypothetical protein
MQPRADHEVARYIYHQKGLKALREWHSLPFCQIEEKALAEWLQKRLPEWGVSLPAHISSSPHEYLLWPDAVYFVKYAPDGPAQAGSGIACARVRAYPEEAPPVDSYWTNACNSINSPIQLLISVYTTTHKHLHASGGMDVIVLHSHEDRSVCPHEISGPTLNMLADRINLEGSELERSAVNLERLEEASVGLDRLMRGSYDWVRTVLAYLSQTPAYPVEQKLQLNDRQRAKAAKTARKFPWSRPDLPSIIFIDFKQAAARGWKGGTHATPAPHQRRGHWRTYQHEKWGSLRGQRRWVRHAWIGDKEWVFNGQRYKVVEPEDPSTKSEDDS